MHLKTFLFYFRIIEGSGDVPPTTQNRHVSLANIATAFLTERKSSSRRHSINRRKKRATIQKRTSNPRHQNNTSNDILGQRISLDTMDGGIATIFMASMSSTNPNNKHRTALVIKSYF
jgi:hypothetical protein